MLNASVDRSRSPSMENLLFVDYVAASVASVGQGVSSGLPQSLTEQAFA
jgi:hypothetical protein